MSATVVARGPSNVRMRFKPGLVGAKGDPGPQGLVSLDQVADIVSQRFSMTRAGIATAKGLSLVAALTVSGYYAPGDLGEGMGFIQGTSAGPEAIYNVPSGKWFELNLANREAKIGWFGAKGDLSAADTSAITRAIASAATVVDVPPGVFACNLANVPDGKLLKGAGFKNTMLVSTVDCSYAVRIGAGTVLMDMTVNGNLHAAHCVNMAGPFSICRNVYTNYSKRDTVAPGTPTTGGAGSGFFNEVPSTKYSLEHCRSDNNRFGFYAAGGTNNCRISAYDSSGDDWGMYYTHEGDNPFTNTQGIFVDDASLIGNQIAIQFGKKVYDFVFSRSTIDVCYVNSILLAEDSSSVAIGPLNFISANSIGVNIDIGAGVTNLNIFDNQGISNGLVCIWVRATATKRATAVSIRTSIIGPSAANSMVILDSPADDWQFWGNVLSPYNPGTDFQVLTLGTWTAGVIGKADVRNNCFQNSFQTASASYTNIRSNTGIKTYARIPISIPAGTTAGQIAIPHGLSRAPFNAVFAPNGPLGSANVYALPSEMDATNIYVRVSGSVPATTGCWVDIYAN